jgi:hypothetical protein
METLDYIKAIDTSKCNIVPQKSERYGVGSLIQLSALGPQDEYLSGNVETDLFEIKHQTHSPILPYEDNLDFKILPKFGTLFKFNFPLKKSLMLKNLILEVELPSIDPNFHWKNNVGYKLLKHVRFSIDNITITEYTGQYLYIYSILHNKKHTDSMIFTGSLSSDVHTTNNAQRLFLFLPLFPEQHFPISSLYNSVLSIEIQFESYLNLVKSVDSSPLQTLSLQIIPSLNRVRTLVQISSAIEELKYIQCQLLCDYSRIMAEDDIERLLHKDLSFVYQSVQIQEEVINSKNKTIDLHFNNAIKQLILIFEDSNGNFIKPSSIKFIFDKSETFFHNESDYYKYIQSFFYGQKIPLSNVYCYSFCLDSSSIYPSGTLNFSKFKKKLIEIEDILPCTLKVFALCYKVFETSQGFGKITT